MTTSLERNTHLKTAGGLAAALAFVATEAAAGVVYNDIEDRTVTGFACVSTVSASFDPISGASTACFGSALFAIGLTNCSGSTNFTFGSSSGSITAVSFLSAPVSAGTLIDSSSAWTDVVAGQSVSAPTYDFNQHALVAYRFKAGSDTYLYGWAEFSRDYVNPTPSAGLYSYAYEDSGAGILAGATTSSIPEPSVTAVLFGLTAFALIGFRRIRQRPGRA